MLIKTYSYKGIWWFPEKEDYNFSGTLDFEPNQRYITLEIITSSKLWYELSDHSTYSDIQILLGIIKYRNEEITLYKCLEIHHYESAKGITNIKFIIDTVYIGHHYCEKKLIKFNELFINYNYLDSWVQKSILKEKLVKNGKGKQFIYEIVKPFKLTRKNKDEIFLNISIEEKHKIYKALTIGQEAYISIRSSAEKEFEDFFETMQLISNFLSLATNEIVFPLAFKGITQDSKEEVEIIYKFDYIYFSELIFKISLRDILFSFSEIKHKVAIYLDNWLKKSEVLGPVYELYFGSLYNPLMYPRYHFLSLVQALESYHQRIICDISMPEKKYNAMLVKILESVPTEFKEWLEKKLIYANELSLRDRLSKIFSNNSNTMGGLLLKNNSKALIQKIVDTRNYFTHNDKELKDKATTGFDLIKIIQILKLLVINCFLKEIGFDEIEITKIMQKAIRKENVVLIN